MGVAFEIAAASVAGRSHRQAGRNNQDALHCLCTDDCTVAVVCDGCGSGAHSEVGAQLGAVLTARVLARHAASVGQGSTGATPDSVLGPDFWERARADILAGLGRVAKVMTADLPGLAVPGGQPPHTAPAAAVAPGMALARMVSDYLLFTVVGALLTPQACSFFSAGDGVLFVNGEPIPLGPFAGNAPPYLAYGLLDDGPQAPRIQVHRTLPTQRVESFLLGTDGVADLLARQERPLPGRTEGFRPLAGLWRDERFFRNPDALRRRLEAASRDWVGIDPTTGGLRREPGLLPDDTTLLIGRRAAGGQSDGHHA